MIPIDEFYISWATSCVLLMQYVPLKKQHVLHSKTTKQDELRLSVSRKFFEETPETWVLASQ
jgi:hypothetical protein